MRRLWVTCAVDFPIYTGARHGSWFDRWFTLDLHRAGYGSPGHSQHGVDLAPFSHLLLQLNKPLVPGYGINAGALLVLLALSMILSGVAIWLFVRRDIGGTVKLPVWLRLPERAARPEQALPVNAWSLRSVYTRGLGTMVVPAFWWTLAIAGFAAWMVLVVKQTESQLETI